MKPAKRTVETWRHLSNLNASIRRDGKMVYLPNAIEADKCARCDAERVTFPDKESKSEFRLTGLCQHCQDKLYATLERNNPGGEPI